MKYNIGDVVQGDVLVQYEFNYIVEGVIGNLVALSNSNGSGILRTFEKLEQEGYTVKQPEPETIELTLQDIADLKGVAVERIKVVE
jgi:hypothetical protein